MSCNSHEEKLCLEVHWHFCSNYRARWSAARQCVNPMKAPDKKPKRPGGPRVSVKLNTILKGVMRLRTAHGKKGKRKRKKRKKKARQTRKSVLHVHLLCLVCVSHRHYERVRGGTQVLGAHNPKKKHTHTHNLSLFHR
jgi:hypothetical protein